MQKMTPDVYGNMLDEIMELEKKVEELEKTIIYAKDVVSYYIDEDIVKTAFGEEDDDSEKIESLTERFAR